MSNCIQFHDENTVIFSPDEIDIPKFLELMNRVKDLKDPPNYKTDWDGHIAWWYLEGNSSVVDEKLVIEFGQGRSSHTVRDFRQTFNVVGNYMKKSKRHKFMTTNEYDGFATAEPWVVMFEPRSALSGPL